jgi:recombination protein RecT
VMNEAKAAIAKLKAHRLDREAKVIKAMLQRPDGSLEDWTASAYDEVDPRIWPIAQRSLAAHVERVRERGLAVAESAST